MKWDRHGIASSDEILDLMWLMNLLYISLSLKLLYCCLNVDKIFYCIWQNFAETNQWYL